ncbi:unnamed protein product, partial [Rotaria socialis]
VKALETGTSSCAKPELVGIEFYQQWIKKIILINIADINTNKQFIIQTCPKCHGSDAVFFREQSTRGKVCGFS